MRVIPRLDTTIANLQASVRSKDEEIAELKKQLQTIIFESGVKACVYHYIVYVCEPLFLSLSLSLSL